MRHRDSLDISIKDFLSLPPADTARFHSGNSLEFLFCRFLTAAKEQSLNKTEQNAKLFELALRSELSFCDLGNPDNARFFTQVLPYTIMMTLEGEEQRSLMRVLADTVPNLANQIDLARIDFVLSGTITNKLTTTSVPASNLVIKYPLSLESDLNTDEGDSFQWEGSSQDSQDLETITRLEEAYTQDLESNDTFSKFLALCAEESTLPVCDDNRYLEAVAKFVESTISDYPPPRKLLNFVIEQVAGSQYFFDDRLKSCQLSKLRHFYLHYLISDLIKSDNRDCDRDPDIEKLFGLEDLSNDDLLWINNACQATAHSYLLPPSSNELISLAAAHKIFLADKAQWHSSASDSSSRVLLPEPLFHPVFNELLPGQLLEQVGITSPDSIRSFCIAWGSKSFGALVKALHFSWYMGGISNPSGDLNNFNSELLKLAFEQAMQTDDIQGPADLTLEFMTQTANARPQAEWLTNGIREVFYNHCLVPGELGFILSDPLEIFSEIQRKLNQTGRFIDRASIKNQQDKISAQKQHLDLLANSLKQRGLDITPDELQSWLKQTLVDSLGDWRREKDPQGEGLTALPLARDFVGLQEFTLSEWDLGSILGGYFSLSTPESWSESGKQAWISDLIRDYCSDLKKLAPDMGAMKAVSRLVALIIAHPYSDHPSGSYDRFAHIRLRELANSFGATVGAEDSIAAARTAIRFCFLSLCDDLNRRKDPNNTYETAASNLADRLYRIDQVSRNPIFPLDLFEDSNIFQELKDVAAILLPSLERPELVVNSFMIRSGYAFRSLQ